MPGKKSLTAAMCALLGLAAAAAPAKFKHFQVTVYIPVNIVKRMAAHPGWLRSSWARISRNLPVNQVFIESFRSDDIASGQQLETVKRFFRARGVQVAGGIAWSGPGGYGQFRSLCYTDPATRAMVRRVSALTARHFNQIILDDFFFNNTKTASDIQAKGNRSWARFRLKLMDEVAQKLILGPARAANPRVRIIIKFPNWYPSFPGLGYDLQREPGLFGEIWTGDETRDPIITDQQLQPYESYEIFRYFENVAPGHNGGGWVDPYSIRYFDRYPEQLWDTLLAKAPALNLFEYTNLLQPARPGRRTAWAGLKTSFNWKQMLRRSHLAPGQRANLADADGYTLRKIDSLLGKLGTPVGLASYRPYQSDGENFLRDELGMIGLPIEMSPHFAHAPVVLLTKTARFDPDIVARIARRLQAGETIVITSGLLQALQNHGFSQITDLRVTDHELAVNSYRAGFGAGNGRLLQRTQAPILFPQVNFDTNEDWAVVRGMADGRGVPMLITDHYGKGTLMVWTMPENLNDLYKIPMPVLNAIKHYITGSQPVRLYGPAQVSLFEYSNGTFVVESFLNHPVTVQIAGQFAQIRNLRNRAILKGKKQPAPFWMHQISPHYRFTLRIEPHSYRAFSEKAE